MNKILANFLKVGLKIAEAQVPAIALVESSIRDMKAGKDKKEAVLEIVKASPSILESVLDKEIVNDQLFIDGISKINDGYVDVMNAIKKHSDELPRMSRQ